jgi:chemotaxis protein histidine kinase CheA
LITSRVALHLAALPVTELGKSKEELAQSNRWLFHLLMSTDKGDPSGKQNLDAALAEAKAVLEEMKQLKAQASEQAAAAVASRAQAEEALKAGEVFRDKSKADGAAISSLLEETRKARTLADEHLKGAEAARKKADDDALYASQAKNNTEAHAKAVASYKGQAEGEFTTLTTNKQKSDELLQAVTHAKTACDADARSIEVSRKAVEGATIEIMKAAEDGTARAEEVAEASDAIASARKEAENMRDASIQARNKADEAKDKVESYSEQASAFAAKMAEVHKTAAASATEIDGFLSQASEDEEGLKEILDRLTKSDGVATGHEARIAKLSQELETLIKKTESLLPGATSAGLASAFNSQRERFGSPQRRWLYTFIVCMVGLIAVSTPSFLHAAFGSGVSTWGDIFRGMAMRLPIVVPLVWLAIYAGRNYMLSIRLEEEYAYKEAVSRAFEGYKREMEKITTVDVNNPTPLTALCTNVLTAIAERPGRIYEGKQYDITMLNEMKAAANGASALGQKTIANQ